MSISGEASDLATVTPEEITAKGSCEFACDVRIWARTWSMLGSVWMSKSIVSDIAPLLPLTEVM